MKMTEYTIGVYFNASLDRILFVKKIKPEWQKGLLNFPGGKKESNEIIKACISREFKEETNLNVPEYEWLHIGEIKGKDYIVHICTAVQRFEHGKPKSMTPEVVSWRFFETFKSQMFINNISMIAEAALTMLTQNKEDKYNFCFVTFQYN